MCLTHVASVLCLPRDPACTLARCVWADWMTPIAAHQESTNIFVASSIAQVRPSPGSNTRHRCVVNQLVGVGWRTVMVGYDVVRALAGCAPGKYQPSHGATACLECEPGFFCPNGGAMEQIPCEMGTHATSSGQATCTSCKPSLSRLRHMLESALRAFGSCPR